MGRDYLKYASMTSIRQLFVVSICVLAPLAAKPCSDNKLVAREISMKWDGNTTLFYGEFHDVAQSRQTILKIMKDYSGKIDCFAFEAFTVEDKKASELFEEFLLEEDLESAKTLDQIFPAGAFWDSNESAELFLEARKRHRIGRMRICPFNRTAPTGKEAEMPTEIPATVAKGLRRFLKEGKWHPEQIRSALMANTLERCLRTCSNSLVVIGSMHAARMNNVKDANRLDVADLYALLAPKSKLVTVFDARIHEDHLHENADLMKLNERNRESKCARLVSSHQLVGSDEMTKQVRQVFDFAIVGDLATQIQSRQSKPKTLNPAPAVR